MRCSITRNMLHELKVIRHHNHSTFSPRTREKRMLLYNWHAISAATNAICTSTYMNQVFVCSNDLSNSDPALCVIQRAKETLFKMSVAMTSKAWLKAAARTIPSLISANSDQLRQTPRLHTHSGLRPSLFFLLHPFMLQFKTFRFVGEMIGDGEVSQLSKWLGGEGRREGVYTYIRC
jgi:hypothetical protein